MSGTAVSYTAGLCQIEVEAMTFNGHKSEISFYRSVPEHAWTEDPEAIIYPERKE